jgi:hypothetical protein
MKLKPGDVFNPQFVEDFYNDNRSLLPRDVSPRESAEIKPDARNSTVAIVLGVRLCPQVFRSPPSLASELSEGRTEQLRRRD